jgi:hypothetical protein
VGGASWLENAPETQKRRPRGRRLVSRLGALTRSSNLAGGVVMMMVMVCAVRHYEDDGRHDFTGSQTRVFLDRANRGLKTRGFDADLLGFVFSESGR